MKITLQQIEAFFWAARLGSFHAAARHLNYTQPAISARIEELEATLHAPLFLRQHQRIELTNVGRNALTYAERLLSAGQDMERLRTDGMLRGVLRFGADESSAMAVLTDVLARLRALHPGLQIEVTVDVGSVLRDKVNRRELDMAIHTSNGEKRPAHVVEQLLGWLKFQWIAASSLGISGDAFSPTQAVALPIVTTSPSSIINKMVRQWLQGGGYDFTSYNSCSSLSLMLRLVEAGHAIAVFPTSVTQSQIDAGTLQALNAEPAFPLVPFALSHLSEDRSSDLAEVIAIVQDALLDAGYCAEPVPHSRSDYEALKRVAANAPSLVPGQAALRARPKKRDAVRSGAST